ncbi:SRPBCC family protein [Mycobacterium basiliense]|uniref:SRPBCC family protein n=1 Tax=Mycobacterium basiliense TaxID=2094119 RepID=UPI001E2C5BBB|nr:SRPBCC family protein [Mycobacterium basiliense]
MPTVWTVEEHPHCGVQATVLTVEDGGRFRVTRIGAGHGVPVVLIPGTFDNRRLYLWPGGGGLAEMLAAAGFDAWIVERRGTGGVALSAQTRAGWAEMVRVDLPAAQRLINAETGRSAFWIGHSFGGAALARAAAETLQASQVEGLVLVNAALDIPLLANRMVVAAVTARLWGGVFPARRFRLGPEDEPVAALEDAVLWGATERAQGQIAAKLNTLDVPILALTSPRDAIAPATRCHRLARSFAGSDRRIQSAARRHGFARNHSHESPLLHPGAAADVFAFVRDWLTARSGATRPASTDTAAPTGRHRIDCTAELDASPEHVFHVLTRQWATLWPVRQRRVRDGVHPDEPDGLRSVRAQRVLGIWPIQEEIVTHSSPTLIEYRTVRGPVRNHHGRVELTPVSTGRTRLDYLMTFDTPPWMPGRLLVVALERVWRQWSLPRLRQQMTPTR